MSINGIYNGLTGKDMPDYALGAPYGYWLDQRITQSFCKIDVNDFNFFPIWRVGRSCIFKLHEFVSVDLYFWGSVTMVKNTDYTMQSTTVPSSIYPSDGQIFLNACGWNDIYEIYPIIVYLGLDYMLHIIGPISGALKYFHISGSWNTSFTYS